jgi:hypothetical protein
MLTFQGQKNQLFWLKLTNNSPIKADPLPMRSILATRKTLSKRLVSIAMLLFLCSCSISNNKNSSHQSEPTDFGNSKETQTVEMEVFQALRTILSWEATLSQRAIPKFVGQEADSLSASSSVWADLRRGFQLQAYYDQASRQGQLNYYLSQENYFETITERGSPFFPDIVRVVETHGLPAEAALMPLVEAALVTTAVSHKNAAGLWQFTSRTGESYGLPSDEWYEARFDPMRSTLAALEYLKYLAKMFDNQWLVVFAAYNMGENELIARASRAGLEPTNENIWEISIPRETRNHIARILALANILENPSTHSVQLHEFEATVKYENVETERFMSFEDIAAYVDLSAEDISKLNPAYLKSHTHPVYPQYVLLPVSEAQKLKLALNL